ncbi:MAG: DUF58 domain-containing protein [Deltaproteobacteria bacterium]|nr:DUF58 domain-containing protein [Deltaproteobacteria bacterium]
MGTALTALTSPSLTRWERFRRYMRPPRRLRFTREGWYFFFISLGVGLAAINTGNNLLYLILGMTLSLIIVSGILSEVTLRRLEVRRAPPDSIHAKRPFLMGISLANSKRRYPSYSIEVEDLLGDRPLEKKCYFLKVPSGRVQQTSYRYEFPRRGRYALTGFRVSTKFPFALFRKSRVVEAPADVVVFPELVDIRSLLTMVHPSMGETSRTRVGRGEDFYSLREFHPGDDSREIHWKATAKVGHLLIREREEEAARQVAICLFSGDVGEETPAYINERERLVSIAASLVCHFIALGNAVSLVTLEGAIPPAHGRDQALRILRACAVLKFEREPKPFLLPKGARVDRIGVVHRRAAHLLPAKKTFTQIIEVGEA